MAAESLQVQRSPAPVREQVSIKLRQAVMDQTFAPSQLLLERELCEMTGVSRASVREALRQAEGLVEMVPNQGPIVARVTPEDARQIYDARTVLEGLAGRSFAVRATDEQVEQLTAAVDAIEQVIASGQQQRLLELKDAFYGILLEGSENVVAGKMLDRLYVRITFLRSTTIAQPRRPAQTLAELRKIVDQIRARNPERTESLYFEQVRKAEAHRLGRPRSRGEGRVDSRPPGLTMTTQ